MPGELGPFAEIVRVAGFLIAFAAAIAFAWRRRLKWEPPEEELPKGPEQVGGLIAAVLLGVLWFATLDGRGDSMLIPIALSALAACVCFVLVYWFLWSTKTFETGAAGKRVIGGFQEHPWAAKERRIRRETSRQYLEGRGFDTAKVWTEGSIAAAKVVFLVCYLGLTVLGSIALAAVAILVAQAVST